MSERQMDLNDELMLDGNAVGGLLYDLMGTDMTTAPAECAHCGNVAQMGALHAFTQAPGIVLYCPACDKMVLRIVKTPDAIYLDARGAAYIRLALR